MVRDEDHKECYNCRHLQRIVSFSPKFLALRMHSRHFPIRRQFHLPAVNTGDVSIVTEANEAVCTTVCTTAEYAVKEVVKKYKLNGGVDEDERRASRKESRRSESDKKGSSSDKKGEEEEGELATAAIPCRQLTDQEWQASWDKTKDSCTPEDDKTCVKPCGHGDTILSSLCIDCPQYQLVTVEDLKFESKGTLSAVLCRVIGPHMMAASHKPLMLALFPALSLSLPLASESLVRDVIYDKGIGYVFITVPSDPAIKLCKGSLVAIGQLRHKKPFAVRRFTVVSFHSSRAV